MHNTDVELDSHKQKSKQLHVSECVEQLLEITYGTVESMVKLQSLRLMSCNKHKKRIWQYQHHSLTNFKWVAESLNRISPSIVGILFYCS